MNKLFIALFICFALINCLKPEKEKIELSDLTHLEQEDKVTIQVQTIDDKEMLPKIEITCENIFAEFPESPEYFVENDIDVTIERIDERSSQFPKYYGLEPVYVTGENFKIIYATDNGYELRLIRLKGKSIFSYWNQYFDVTWNDVEKSWGKPEAGSKTYFDSTGWYYIGFTVDNLSDKIKEIEIGESL
jgi:hypothetical protein